MDDFDVLDEILGEELYGCISQAAKKPKRASQGAYTAEKMLSQELEERQQKELQKAAMDAARDSAGNGEDGEAEASGKIDYDTNKRALKSVREIAGDLEDEKARDFFNASGNLEKLLGPNDEDDEGAPDIYVRMFSETDSSALARREREGISGLLDSPLNVLSLNDEKAAGRNKRRKTATAANDGEANVAMVHASISGGWLCKSMEFRSRESCNAVVRGLYDVATTSSNRLLAQEATTTLCKVMERKSKRRSGALSEAWSPRVVDIMQTCNMLGYVKHSDSGSQGPAHGDDGADAQGWTTAPFNIRNVLRIMSCMGKTASASPEIFDLLPMILRLAQERSMVVMQQDVHETLAAVLASIDDNSWPDIQERIVDTVVFAKPTSLAACFQMYTLKSALFCDSLRGRTRWRGARFEIASKLLLGRLRMAEMRGSSSMELQSMGGVIQALEVLRKLDFPEIVKGAGQQRDRQGEEKEAAAAAGARCMVAAEGGWEVLSCLRAVDLILEDATDGDLDDDDLSNWIEVLKYVGKCIRGNNTKFERILKAAVTEFSSRYGFVKKGHGPASSFGGTPIKSQQTVNSLLGAIDEDCMDDGAVVGGI